MASAAAFPGARIRTPAGGTVALRTAQWLVLAVCPLVLIAMGWQRRWTSDDGFIGYRVVRNILEGHGPVYNVGERVEVYTSPLWMAVVSVAGEVSKLLHGTADLPWTGVYLGLGLTAAGVVLAQLGALRLLRLAGRDGFVFPLGAAAVAAVAAYWDFATSGLETGLIVAWLGASFWALTTVVERPGRRALAGIGCLLGLGPLVRPDLAIFSAAFLLAVILLRAPSERGRRLLGSVVVLAVAAAVVPVGYEVFRMGYFASVVPNTAIDKEFALPYWSQGKRYLADFVKTYALWFPAALVAIASVTMLLRSRRGVVWIIVLAPVLAAAVHCLYVVRLGGDFMHARMLLPTFFGAVLPAFVIDVGPRRLTTALAVLMLPWVAVAAFALRPSYRDVNNTTLIANERQAWVDAVGNPQPVTLRDYRFGAPFPADHQLLLLVPTIRAHGLAADVRWPEVVDAYNVGMISFLQPDSYYALDAHGLTDPFGSRLLLLARWRPGHEKTLADAWVIARFTPPSPGEPADVAAARRAYACPSLTRLSSLVDGPLSWSGFLRNIRLSFWAAGLRIAPDPVVAARC